MRKISQLLPAIWRRARRLWMALELKLLRCPLRDGDLKLVLTQIMVGDGDIIPSYRFEMRHAATGEEIGNIKLRAANTPDITRYFGHIAYGVLPTHRGHRYAARSCRLLLPFARRRGLNPLWITCNPNNPASRRTCELLGAQFVEIVPVPPHMKLYQRGDTHLCRYRLEL